MTAPEDKGQAETPGGVNIRHRPCRRVRAAPAAPKSGFQSLVREYDCGEPPTICIFRKPTGLERYNNRDNRRKNCRGNGFHLFAKLGGGGARVKMLGHDEDEVRQQVQYAIAVVARVRREGHLSPRRVEGGVADAVEAVRESGYPGLVPIAQQPGAARVGEQEIEAGVSPPLLLQGWDPSRRSLMGVGVELKNTMLRNKMQARSIPATKTTEAECFDHSRTNPKCGKPEICLPPPSYPNSPWQDTAKRILSNVDKK